MANTDEMKKFQYGGLAGRFLSEKDLAGAKGSLEGLAKDLGFGPELQGFIEGTFASEKGIEKAVGTYMAKYQEFKGKSTVKELGTYYDQLIDEYLESKSPEAKAELDQYQTEAYGDILRKVTQAQEKIKSKTGNFSQQDKDDAQKVLDKYNKVVAILETMEEVTFDKLATGVTKNVRKKELQSLFP